MAETAKGNASTSAPITTFNSSATEASGLNDVMMGRIDTETDGTCRGDGWNDKIVSVSRRVLRALADGTSPIVAYNVREMLERMLHNGYVVVKSQTTQEVRRVWYGVLNYATRHPTRWWQRRTMKLYDIKTR